MDVLLPKSTLTLFEAARVAMMGVKIRGVILFMAGTVGVRKDVSECNYWTGSCPS